MFHAGQAPYPTALVTVFERSCRSLPLVLGLAKHIIKHLIQMTARRSLGGYRGEAVALGHSI